MSLVEAKLKTLKEVTQFIEDIWSDGTIVFKFPSGEYQLSSVLKQYLGKSFNTTVEGLPPPELIASAKGLPEKVRLRPLHEIIGEYDYKFTRSEMGLYLHLIDSGTEIQALHIDLMDAFGEEFDFVSAEKLGGNSILNVRGTHVSFSPKLIQGLRGLGLFHRTYIPNDRWQGCTL